jgi:hypothetical protein
MCLGPNRVGGSFSQETFSFSLEYFQLSSRALLAPSNSRANAGCGFAAARG